VPISRDLGFGLGIFVLVLFQGACGPSIRMMHESSLYFERCHAAELIDGVSMSDRVECWHRWVEHYAYGQEPARVLYARERIAFLSQGEAIEPLPTGEPAEPEAEADIPELPPAMLDNQGTVPVPHRYIPGIPSPRVDRENPVCMTHCRPEWDACAAPCVGDPNRRACLGACQSEFTACMHACY
jgi:hypothetical protein